MLRGGSHETRHLQSSGWNHRSSKFRFLCILRLKLIPTQYIPSAGSFVPISHFVSALPRLTYQLFFERETSAATLELNKDIRRTIRATLRSVGSPPPEDFLKSPDSFLAGWKDEAEVDKAVF